jgi:hypothetical protein
MQLHDFSDMQVFPVKLRYLCICLSEVICIEDFLRKNYDFISGHNILHLVGTYDKSRYQEEEEIYEVVIIHKAKASAPNLHIINLYNIDFIDDSHIDAFSSNCIQYFVVNFCSFNTLFQPSKRLKCLLLSWMEQACSRNINSGQMVQNVSEICEMKKIWNWILFSLISFIFTLCFFFILLYFYLNLLRVLQKLDISVTDLSTECLIDMLTISLLEFLV